MNSELKLHFLKQLINVPMRLLDKLIQFPVFVEHPQTKLLLRTYKVMLYTYMLDCSQGTFGTKPDGNFERLIRVCMKLLSQISERDRYYRAWIGLLFLLARDEIHAFNPSPAFLKREIKRQWQNNLDALPDSMLIRESEDFREWLLCDGLYNLATGFFMGTKLPKKHGGKQEK